MELEIIADADKILGLHKKFVNQMGLHNDLKKKHNLTIATRGGHSSLPYLYNKETGLWWVNEPGYASHKHYNRFGFSPNEDSTNRMVVQVNYSKIHDSFREAGAWGVDKKNRYYLLHSGKMGGGVEGITKENVDRLINAQRVYIDIGNKEQMFYIVCKLGDKKMFYQVMAFVEEIRRVKNILMKDDVNTGKILIEKNKQASKLKKYFPEFWGKREYKTPKIITGNCNHGYVVHCLMQELHGHGEMVKSQFIDLGISKKGKPIALFEIKTNCDKQSIYTAVGQLVLHSATTKVNPDKYFVVPNVVDPDLVNDLKGIGINTILYKWQNEKPVFTNLNSYF